MKNLLICTSLVAMFVTGESLICHTCEMSMGGRCWWPSKRTCNGSEFSCFHGKLAFNFSTWMDMETQGCLPSFLCNKTEAGTFLSATYTITKTCCSTDCCNGATSVQLPLTVALITALAVVWSLPAL